jgi:hypothetical protein
MRPWFAADVGDGRDSSPKFTEDGTRSCMCRVGTEVSTGCPVPVMLNTMQSMPRRRPAERRAVKRPET